MGIFKRFRASLSFGIGAVEDSGAVSASGTAVYRPYSSDTVYAAGYRAIEEGSYSSYSSAPVNNRAPRVKSEVPKMELLRGNTRPQSSPAIASTTIADPIPSTEPGTSDGRSQDSNKKHKEKKSDKDKGKKKDKKKKEKTSKGEKEITKKDKNKSKKGKERQETQTNSNNIIPVVENGDALTSAQNPMFKTMSAPNPMTKTTSAQNPMTKTTSAQNPMTKTTSAQNPMMNSTLELGDPPPYTPDNSNPKPRNNLTNPLATQTNLNADSLHEISSGFSSSWDQVAMHRENLHKELRTFQPKNNLRSMMNQNNNEREGGEREGYVRNNRNVGIKNFNSVNVHGKRNTGRFENMYDSGSEADA